jgi:hypothetical protein
MVRVQFQGLTLTRTKTINNIVKAYEMADHEDKYDWYATANEIAVELAKRLPDPLSLSMACGLLAATSPMKTWEQNIKCATNFIEHGQAKHTGMVQRKCEAIMSSDGTVDTIADILNGNKTVAFFHNIRFPSKFGHLTIDRHAISVGLGMWVSQDNMKLTKNQYEFFVQCYTSAAWNMRTTPLKMQSATWSWFRKNKTDFKRF